MSLHRRAARPYFKHVPDWIYEHSEYQELSDGLRWTLHMIAGQSNKVLERCGSLVGTRSDQIDRLCRAPRSTRVERLDTLCRLGFVAKLSQGSRSKSNIYGIPGRPGALDHIAIGPSPRSGRRNAGARNPGAKCPKSGRPTRRESGRNAPENRTQSSSESMNASSPISEQAPPDRREVETALRALSGPTGPLTEAVVREILADTTCWREALAWTEQASGKGNPPGYVRTCHEHHKESVRNQQLQARTEDAIRRSAERRARQAAADLFIEAQSDDALHTLMQLARIDDPNCRTELTDWTPEFLRKDQPTCKRVRQILLEFALELEAA